MRFSALRFIGHAPLVRGHYGCCQSRRNPHYMGILPRGWGLDRGLVVLTDFSPIGDPHKEPSGNRVKRESTITITHDRLSRLSNLPGESIRGTSSLASMLISRYVNCLHRSPIKHILISRHYYSEQEYPRTGEDPQRRCIHGIHLERIRTCIRGKPVNSRKDHPRRFW